MANVTTAYGFRFCDSLVGHAELKQIAVKSSSAVERGDMIISNPGTHATADIALANSAAILGVCAGPAVSAVASAAATTYISYYPALAWTVFHGKCEGTYTAASMDFDKADIIGATSAMYVDENGASTNVLQIIGLLDQRGNAAGLNANVRFIILLSQWLPLL